MEPPVKSAAEVAQRQKAAFNALPWENQPSNNLWIDNVSPTVTHFELKSLFSNYGELISINLYPFHGYALVHFTKVECAKLARQDLLGHILHGKPLMIYFSKPVGDLLLL
ncbi:hypothetical protein Salat_1450300 [Sesamum alatum]|uniref:RRM domain-containing protein n=1 Tax=Sesamum alatum TaxID=300844 RepID=A0AAE2CLP8_9LAMI|nr:hypothetical protein Salat_1450300 [Sesamum alatum]